MKQTDFDRLKVVCEKEGFEIIESHGSSLFQISKKDIWEGVEFVQSISPTSSCTTQWKIYKVKQITEKNIWIEIDDYLSTTTHFVKEKSKPSTEKAYAEQLKAEAFKRLGEIKEGDSFDREDWKMEDERPYGIGVIGQYIQDGFNYRKCNDSLMFRGTTIYRQGKWATRVKEKVKVEPNCESIAKYVKEVTDEQRQKLRVLLASKLEEYLNEKS